MSVDRMVSAEAWDQLVANLIDLGSNPDESDVVAVLVTSLYATEGITLDEDHREASA